MKVILKQDVAKIGRRFDITNVPDGYALNKLIPQGMAEPATPANVKRIQSQKQAKATDQAATHATFVETIAVLKESPVVVSVEANEQGHLFQQLKPADVVAGATAAGVTLLESQVIIPTPIKALGEHDVTLQDGDAAVTVAVSVVAK